MTLRRSSSVCLYTRECSMCFRWSPKSSCLFLQYNQLNLRMYAMKMIRDFQYRQNEFETYLHRCCNISRESAKHSQVRLHTQCTIVRSPICFPTALGPLGPVLLLQDFHLLLSRLWWAWCYLGWQQGIVLSWFCCLVSPLLSAPQDAMRGLVVFFLGMFDICTRRPQRSMASGPRANCKSNKHLKKSHTCHSELPTSIEKMWFVGRSWPVTRSIRYILFI